MQQNLIDNLNTAANKLFSNIEGEVYEILDNIMSIDSNLLKSEPLKVIMSDNKLEIISTIAKSLAFIYVLYYIVTQFIFMYNGENSENVFLFIIKLTLVYIFISNSYYICQVILSFFEILTECVNQLTLKLAGKEANFANLKRIINNVDDLMQDEIFSINGILKAGISFGIINLLIIFSVRYVKVIFLTLISPFCFSFFASSLTRPIFENWLKSLIENLMLQIIIKFIMLIPMLFKDSSSTIFKVVLLGTIYMIYKANSICSSFSQNINIFNKGK